MSGLLWYDSTGKHARELSLSLSGSRLEHPDGYPRMSRAFGAPSALVPSDLSIELWRNRSRQCGEMPKRSDGIESVMK